MFTTCNLEEEARLECGIFGERAGADEWREAFRRVQVAGIVQALGGKERPRWHDLPDGYHLYQRDDGRWSIGRARLTWTHDNPYAHGFGVEARDLRVVGSPAEAVKLLAECLGLELGT